MVMMFNGYISKYNKKTARKKISRMTMCQVSRDNMSYR